MTMAHRIVVMKDGYIMQVGTPKEIYDLLKIFLLLVLSAHRQ